MSKMKLSKNNIHRDQAGLVSIMVTLILIVVIALIVAGFGTVARRNQRETLDRQLSTQAYYAAESGINEAISAVNNGTVTLAALNDPSSTYDTNCATFTTKVGANSNQLNGTNVDYSCLLINSQPNNLEANVTIGSSQVLYLNMTDPTGSLTFTWPAKGSGTLSSCPTNFTPTSKWTCPYGVLRVDLYQVGGALDASTMANNTISLYFLPSSAASSSTPVAFGDPTTSAYKAAASCTATTCTATITGMGTSLKQYYTRLTSVYDDAGKVSISAGTDTKFLDAQLVIDATGRAQDEVKRIQVRVSPPPSDIPPDALQTTNSTCKRYTVGPAVPADPGLGSPTPLCSTT